MKSLVPVLPEIYLTIIAIVSLLTGVFSSKEKSFQRSYLITFLGVFATFIIMLTSLGLKNYDLAFIIDQQQQRSLFLSHDLLIFAKIFILLCVMILLPVAKSYLITKQYCKYEFNSLIVFALVGGFLAISTTNLLVLFIALELFSYSIYILVAFMRDSKKAVTSAIKYFVMGSIASVMLLYGTSLVYLSTGGVFFEDIGIMIAQNGINNLSFELMLGVLLIIGALFFKLAIAPMHLYLSDVLYGANRPTLGLIMTVDKIVGFIILYQLLSVILPTELIGNVIYSYIVIAIALINILIGSIMAIKEDNLNRFLAYSSINNIGFMLILAANLELAGLITYMLVYCITLIAIVCYTLSIRIRGEYIKDISQLAIISKYDHKFALMGVFLIFVLAGLPPFAMFYAKLVVVKALIDKGFIISAVLAVVFSIFAVRYCIKVIRHIYFEKLEEDIFVQFIPTTKIMTYLLVLVILVISIYPNLVIGGN